MNLEIDNEIIFFFKG